MSWLGNIYESIVNEISADDAYNRFYSNIPRDKYDEILNGNPAPDRFMQFILNCARDEGKFDDAVTASQSYALLPQDAKQAIQNGVKNGEYKTLDELQSMIDYFHAGGGITSRIQFAKKGYIKVKETDDAIVTCTTNYLANNHFFGKTHWCTASDREGQYDGYQMFLRYGRERDSVLIQFKPKKKILPKGEVEYPSFYPSQKEEDENAVRFEFQAVQVNVDVDGRIGDICDFEDTGMTRSVLRSLVGEEAYSVLEDGATIKKLLEIQNEQYGDEKKYQDKKEELIRKRKEERRRRIAEERARNDEIVEQKMSVIREESLKLWNEFIGKELYNDPEMLAKLWEMRDNGGDCEYSEEDCYCAAIVEGAHDENICVLGLVPVFKEVYWVEDDENEFGEITGSRVLSATGRMNPVFGYQCVDEFLWLIVEVESSYYAIDEFKKVLFKSYAHNNDYGPSTNEVHATNREHKSMFVITEFGKKNILFDPDTREMYDLGGRFNGYGNVRNMEIFGDEYIVLINGWGLKAAIIDKETKTISDINSNSQYVITGSDCPILALSMDRQNYSFIIDTGEDKEPITFETNFGELLNGGVKIENFTLKEGIVKIRTTNYCDNAIDIKNPKEPIFGMWGTQFFILRNGGVGLRFHKGDNEPKIIFYENGEYRLFKDDDNDMYHGKGIPCDKYGHTEEDEIALKNFRDWQAAGGHSPEAKAQMEKMWNDRDDSWSSFNGEKAMQDWDDADRGLDARADNTMKYDKNFGFNAAMQKFDDDDKWGGYVGVKDPEGYSKDMAHAITTMSGEENGIQRLVNGEIPDGVRKNPWYRVGKDGKPLDQTWYDEDEIPANLSDRVVRENKIRKEFNNLQSIMRRMGLLD